VSERHLYDIKLNSTMMTKDDYINLSLQGLLQCLHRLFYKLRS
jgi:hypothetical protein